MENKPLTKEELKVRLKEIRLNNPTFIKYKRRSTLEYLMLAKKAAHKYAMSVVIEPLKHRKAVLDVSQSFFVGAMEYREAMEIRRTIGKIPPHYDTISQNAFDNFFTDFFEEDQSDDLKESVKEDIDAGAEWAIYNEMRKFTSKKSKVRRRVFHY